MASVAIPIVASFVVNKIGESQGWDPRVTAVLSAAAGFGVGTAFSAGTAVAASAASQGTAVTGGMAGGSAAKAAGITTMGRGALGAKLAGAGNMAGAYQAAGTYGAATTSAANIAPKVWGGSAIPSSELAIPPSGLGSPVQAPVVTPGGVTRVASGELNGVDMWANAPVYTPKKLTMGDAMGNQIDAWTKDPVDPVTGKPTGELSAAKNFGASALKTLLKPLPQKAPVGGGGGGGGPQAPAYQGGGGGQYQTVWSFGQPNQGYKPQGI